MRQCSKKVSYLENRETTSTYCVKIGVPTRGLIMDRDWKHTKLSEFINSELEAQGWTGLDFCSMLGGVPKSVGSKIANGKQTPTFKQIFAMSKMFDVPVDKIVMMRLFEEACQNGSTLAVPEKQRELIEVFKKVPVSTMISNHWVGVRDRNDPEELLRVFGPLVEDLKKSSALAHKSRTEDTKLSNLQMAWLLRVRALAREMKPEGAFSQASIGNAIEQLRAVMSKQRSTAEVVPILDQAGIRLVFVECKNSCIDGVCTWLDKDNPVIGMTLRYDRVDNFWFVLRHELAHIEQGYEQIAPVDCDLDKATVSGLEEDANSVAEQFCVPKGVVDRFLKESDGRFTDESVLEFAELNSIHPSVMAGQIRHRLSRYNILTKLMVKYRSELLQSAIKKDGWGYVPA